MAEYEFIKVADQAGVFRITLSREPLNILNIAMMEEICGALEGLQGRTDLKVVVFDAVGKALARDASARSERQQRAELKAAF